MQLSIMKWPNHSVNKPVPRRSEDALGMVSGLQGKDNGGCPCWFCIHPQVQGQNDFVHFLRKGGLILYVPCGERLLTIHLLTKHLNSYFISVLIAEKVQCSCFDSPKPQHVSSTEEI